MRQLHDKVIIELIVWVIEVEIVIYGGHDVRIQATVGDRIFETLSFSSIVNFSVQDASILKISVPISKRSS